MGKSKRAGYVLLTLLFGAALFAIDVLPLLAWIAFQPWEAAVTDAARAGVIRSFIAVVAFNVFWAWGVHRALHAVQCLRSRRSADANAETGTPRRRCGRHTTPAKA
jgi:sterol desaturase/sphingolipid hydroxylase (fatty acid hydroxylase superfamily)